MDEKTKAEIEMLEAQAAFWKEATKLVKAWNDEEEFAGDDGHDDEDDEGMMGAVGSVLERHGVDPEDV